MVKEIWFDMDGTIANLYGVKGWLNDIENENTRPYDEADVMVNMRVLARVLNRLIKKGYKVGIISWTARGASVDYGRRIEESKKRWLSRHLNSVKFNEINIVEYGKNKWNFSHDKNAILFDDEEKNRKEWKGKAYDESKIMEVLKSIA